MACIAISHLLWLERVNHLSKYKERLIKKIESLLKFCNRGWKKYGGMNQARVWEPGL